MKKLSCVLIICSFFSSHMVGQTELNNLNGPDEKNFRFKWVSIDNEIITSIDSIVSFRNECEFSDLYWYLNFERKGDTIVYILSSANIERLVGFIQTRDIAKSNWKAGLVNNRIVIVVDAYGVITDSNDCFLEIKNPQRIDPAEITFVRSSSWVFAVIDSTHYLITRNPVRCN